MLAGCAEPRALPTDPAGRLFARGLDEIAEFYIAPTSGRSLALGGAERLPSLDRSLSLAETPAPGSRAEIVLGYHDREVVAEAEPADDDRHGWGALLGRLVAAAKSVSPAFAALPADRIETAVLDGIAARLDRFSHYASPQAAHRRRALRDGIGGVGSVGPSVTMTRDRDIAVFRILSFNQDTTRELVRDLGAALRETPARLRGVVLDLRGDPGGLLDQAVGVADAFVARGPIVATSGRHPASRQLFEASGDSLAPLLPIVVLINGRSASAAEIVAAALQDPGRAVVVGSSSYGKGTVQTVIPLPNGGELTVTWALLIAPSGYLMNGHGVVPTLCTSDLGDDAHAVEVALQRAAAGAPSPLAPRPRASLSEADWTQLRRSCPERLDNPRIDLVVAQRLLADPDLFSQAVHSIAQPARLAVAAAGPRLTGKPAALLSALRSP
jgi:hypothetical protein